MKIAIIYKSVSGNTKLLAEAMKDVLNDEIVYFGEPRENIIADVYFIGSWTDKGMCCAEIKDYLMTMENKKIAYFGTAGFGGSAEYYHSLFERVKQLCSATNEIENYFLCQGKMPVSVRDRYVSMMKEHPDDKNLEVSIKNYDLALEHPNKADLKAVQDWALNIIYNE